MQEIEFETYISGDRINISAHLLSRLSKQRQVKIILLLPEENNSAALHLSGIAELQVKFLATIIADCQRNDRRAHPIVM